MDSTKKAISTQKVTWSEIKNNVKVANIDFFNIVEQINPSSDYPLYLLYFPYGEIIGDKISQFIPANNNNFLRLSDPSLPTEFIKHLGYGKHSSPMGMVLEKNIEWFIDLPSKKISIPKMIQGPGDFFSFHQSLTTTSIHNYAPNGVLSVMSGARSAFVLPSVGCTTKFSKLCRAIGLKTNQPSHVYEHTEFFKAILNSESISHSWLSCLIYFSEPWILKIKQDPEWSALKTYFFNLAWQRSQYLLNQPYYNTAYSLLLEQVNLKPNPYLFDTFKHVIDIMSGQTPGFSPTKTDESLPLKILQNIFVHSYGLKQYYPTIMSPDVFNFDSALTVPTYYSLQFPTTSTFSPKSRNNSSIMFDMREINGIFSKLNYELSRNDNFCSGTIIQQAVNNTHVEFFHNSLDQDNDVKHVSELLIKDERFSQTNTINYIDGMKPAEDAKFFRGCIKISAK